MLATSHKVVRVSHNRRIFTYVKKEKKKKKKHKGGA
ncbi:hypothetical protein AYI69_g10022, partial [Smittium culicis]